MLQGIWLGLTLSSAVLTCSALSLDDAWENDDVTVTRQELVRNQRRVSTTRLAAKDCSQAVTQSRFDDGSTSDVIDDLQNEVSVILLSATPNVCYVRDITGVRGRCQDGSFKVNKGEEDSKEDTVYEQVEEVDIDRLPDAIAALCKGRTILKVTAAATSGSAGAGNGRVVRAEKRAAKCTTYKTNCHECSCEGWLFRARRCRICCDEQTVCDK